MRTTWLDRLAQRVALRSTPTEEAKPAPPLQGKGAGAAPGPRTLSRREALGMAVGASAAFASLDWWLPAVPASATTCDQSLAACIKKANHDGVFAVGKNMVLCVAGFSGLKAVLPKLLGPSSACWSAWPTHFMTPTQISRTAGSNTTLVKASRHPRLRLPQYRPRRYRARPTRRIARRYRAAWLTCSYVAHRPCCIAQRARFVARTNAPTPVGADKTKKGLQFRGQALTLLITRSLKVVCAVCRTMGNCAA